MLATSEREWLERREVIHQCEGDYIWAGYWEEGVELEVMQEAAEFEQRVAAKLARMSVDAMLPCFQTSGDCPYTIPNCAWCRLMVARLAVEEEMNGR